MPAFYDRETDTYLEKRKIGRQTIELGMNYYDENLHDRKSWWNIYLSVYSKRKDKYTNMDKKIITGKDPFATVAAAREMFQNVESLLISSELINGPFDEITIFCTWVDNRRRNVYYKALSKYGYSWGTIDGQKCIMKTYRKKDFLWE